ncbi:MAG: hypothetical protein D6785_16560 [Planctomycetota bacterium]|nr:MAG: hypothetical protein D6785_16560 [Planctomycetota bacterium]
MIQDFFWQNFLSFLYLSFVVAFTQTAIRYEKKEEILRKGTLYFLIMVGSILLFCCFIAYLEVFFH